MFMYVCHDVNAFLWICHDMNVCLGACYDAMMRMPLCGYAMMRMLWCKHNLFKNSFYFQNEASTTPKTKIFSKLDLLFMKKSSSFWLKAPKKLVITVRKSLNGAFTWNLMIWLKRLISTIWLSKEMTHFQGLFGKMNSLKIKHLKKIHFRCF